jgi:hypothetical protein
MPRIEPLRGRPAVALLGLLALAPVAPAQAEEPGAGTEAAVERTAATPEPYAYPATAEPSASYPEGFWRVPAAVVDLLLVRPVMAAGLFGGAGLFVATLPVTAATLTTDDAADALVEQAAAVFVRPLGAF